MKYTIPPRGLGTEPYIVDTDLRIQRLPDLDPLLDRVGNELGDENFLNAIGRWKKTHGPDEALRLRMWAGSLFAYFPHKLPRHLCEAAYIAANAAVELSTNLLAFEKRTCERMITEAEGWLAGNPPPLFS